MPNLLAMSFGGAIAPSFDLRCLEPGRTLPDGWGIGYYPGSEPSASLLKEPAPPRESIRGALVKAWEHSASPVFVVHIRAAKWGAISDANTQPFVRTWGARDWLMAHSGSLRRRLEVPESALFTPVGSTDTEAMFCVLMDRIARAGWRSLHDADAETLLEWFAEFDELGGTSSVISDGRDMCIYADRDGEGPMYVLEVTPPYHTFVLSNADLSVDLCRRGSRVQKGIIVASEMLETTPTHSWRKLEPGTLVIVRQGIVRHEVHAAAREEKKTSSRGSAHIKLPKHADKRRMLVTHRTEYRYNNPIERSSHLFRLTPMHDHFQHVLEHDLTLSVDNDRREFADVFGNRSTAVLIETPYTELVITARTRLDLLDTAPLTLRPLMGRASIPLTLMPWQRHVLDPYLLPPELPESQLGELADYAMSFVSRNDGDLLDTLLDINASIFREYQYQQGSTNLYTTPFDVYTHRRGVCQDFANLFLCMARLLSVPARYVCGYIYTGPKHPNQRQAEASHAWIEVYLPELGWKGFDPTNGIVTQTDHVRIAVGRSYVDATPTSGTIWVGGGPETLIVDVRMEPCD